MSYISMIAPVASKLLDYIFPPITNQFGYLFHHNKNVNNIRELLEKLQDKRSRVEGGYIAKRNGELIESDVERWLTEVVVGWITLGDHFRVFTPEDPDAENGHKTVGETWKIFSPRVWQ
ncbi:hypothetical protein HYC85_024859 [Camellia sinensis]|uniref:Uncharacterized protein n=1 Tax=Camellia sinensis TaxID=4442 RepID=A0A7J7G9B0_CAMSI|nr:hypothetical protein HYC85_024859 [Camellia sinensis]